MATEIKAKKAKEVLPKPKSTMEIAHAIRRVIKYLPNYSEDSWCDIGDLRVSYYSGNDDSNSCLKVKFPQETYVEIYEIEDKEPNEIVKPLLEKALEEIYNELELIRGLKR